jgi:hypothetical protein
MILGGFWISVKPNMFSMKKVHYTYFPMIAGVIVMSTLGFIKLNNYALAGIFALGGLAIMFIIKCINFNIYTKASARRNAWTCISIFNGSSNYKCCTRAVIIWTSYRYGNTNRNYIISFSYI